MCGHWLRHHSCRRGSDSRRDGGYKGIDQHSGTGGWKHTHTHTAFSRLYLGLVGGASAAGSPWGAGHREHLVEQQAASGLWAHWLVQRWAAVPSVGGGCLLLDDLASRPPSGHLSTCLLPPVDLGIGRTPLDQAPPDLQHVQGAVHQSLPHAFQGAPPSLLDGQ